MTQFNVPHVQTVLKSTSSAVQTLISRLEQSQSWNFTKVALTKITAKRGWTPCYKFDRMGIHNHFWPTSQKKVFKSGRKCTIAPAVILTLGQFLAISAHCGVEFQKNFFIRMFLGTFLINAYFTIFFSHAHSGLQSDRKQKTVKSRQIRSKPTMCRHSPMVGTKFLTLPPGTSGQVGLLKSPIKWTYLEFIN